MSDYLIQNGTTLADEKIDICIRDGRIDEILSAGEANAGDFEASEHIDAEGRLVTPPLIEPHFHLDFALSLGKPYFNDSGTLVEGSRTWRQLRPKLDEATIRKRASTVIRWLLANGVTRIRTHVSVSTETDSSVTMDALVAVKKSFEDLVDLQLVPFPADRLQTPIQIDRFERAVRRGDVVGALPQYEYTREDGVSHIETIVGLADEYDMPIDGHIDETDDPQAKMLEVLVREVINHGLGDRTTASHTTAMHSYSDAYVATLLGDIADSGISIVTNPMTNAVIQGRHDGYPRRRGHTRIEELRDAGIAVGIGQDDILDVFHPYGDCDPLTAAHVLIHYAHLNGYDQVTDLWEMLLECNAAVYGLKNYGLEPGNEGSVVVYDGMNKFDVLRRRPPRTAVIREGELLAESEHSTKLHLEDSPDAVEFAHSLDGE